MARTLLALGALLAVSVGCRDGPTAVTAPSEAVDSAPPVVAAAEALATIRDLLADPFVHDLIAVADAGRAGQPTHRSIRNVMDHVSVGESEAVVRALTRAQRDLGNDMAEAEDEHEIERAVLGLMLDEAQDALNGQRELTPAESKYDGPNEGQTRRPR